MVLGIGKIFRIDYVTLSNMTSAAPSSGEIFAEFSLSCPSLVELISQEKENSAKISPLEGAADVMFERVT